MEKSSRCGAARRAVTLILHIVCVGNKPPAWVASGFEDYARRMPREARIELTEIKPAARGSQTQSPAAVARLLEAEKNRILASLPPGCVKIALDEHGKSTSTETLARRMAAWLQDGRDIAFMIGSADGLHPALKKDADMLLSLSAMTLPHAMVRVLLAEQLYRAMSIVRNHPYHRE